MSGRDNQTLQQVIESAIAEASAHIRQLERAHERLAPYFPLTQESLHVLPEDQVPILDQFIYRFMKLQDSMAGRLLPALDAYLRADDSPRPFLDILSHLEQLGAIPSEHEWQFFRALRNNLAHDYPESSAQTVETLNTLYERWDELRSIFDTASSYFRSRRR